MTLLRKVLYLDALVHAVGGLALIAIPRVVLVDLFAQAADADNTLARTVGVSAISLALLMVLIGHRVEDVWWWCWSLVVLEAGSAILLTLHAAFGLPDSASGSVWWAAALLSWLFAFGFLWGIARAGSETNPS